MPTAPAAPSLQRASMSASAAPMSMTSAMSKKSGSDSFASCWRRLMRAWFMGAVVYHNGFPPVNGAGPRKTKSAVYGARGK